jgi:hypothetical protein
MPNLSVRRASEVPPQRKTSSASRREQDMYDAFIRDVGSTNVGELHLVDAENGSGSQGPPAWRVEASRDRHRSLGPRRQGVLQERGKGSQTRSIKGPEIYDGTPIVSIGRLKRVL